MSERVLQRRWQLTIRLITAALVWATGLLLAAVLIGVYKGQTISTEAGLTLTTRTFVQVHGVGALVLVLIPVAACLIVAAALGRRRHHRASWSGPVAWVAVAATTLEALLAITSFGAMLIPVAVLLAVSVRLIPAPAVMAARSAARA
jgi:uncharacterized membrane protein YhaH (DUF805 family)